MKWFAAAVWAFFSLAGCSTGDDAPPQEDAGRAPLPLSMTLEQLRDPETCKSCHPIHYREWSSSMHAYSAQDPVFLAMNKRGQRETNGELGDFCIKCHAPMAVVDKRTKDGLDLEHLPDRQRGVSCYFCHNVVGIEGTHNAKLQLASDNTMRGPIQDPLQPEVHRAEFSEIFDDSNPKSSAMCGGCHDIVTPNGVHLERTLQEYRDGIFSKSATGKPPAFASCAGCHMPGQEALAASVPGAVPRIVHEHLWPGIDVAVTDFPNRAALRSAVEDCQLGAPSLSFFKLEVTPPNIFSFEIETNAGHNQPSGAAQDRRMWLEFLAYDEKGKLLEKVSSGNIADGEIEEKPKGDPKHDPHLLMFRDRIFDAQGKPVHMFWEAAKSTAYPEGFVSNTLPVANTTYIEGKHAVVKQYRASTPDGRLPSRVTARLKIRPIGLDVLKDLVESGDLDPAIVEEMPTLTFGAQIEWTPADGLMKTIAAEAKVECRKYKCLLDPTSDECQ
jgi:nitrate/TMAO reductase-like tetraheme cytochrome c subunit